MSRFAFARYTLNIKKKRAQIIIFTLCYLRTLWYKLVLSENNVERIGGKVLQPVQYAGRGIIRLCHVHIGVWPSPNLLNGVTYIEARSVDASVEIDEGTQINNGATIIADKTNIKIGKRCLIGANFFVCDSDFHGIALKDRRNGNYKCMPVLIGNDVFIGEGVKILKGVSVGDGAVIGTGAVVASDVESNCVYAGVPAKKIKLL